MEGLSAFAAAIAAFATPSSLFNIVWATLLGIAVGMMPGLTATLGVALMTTLTFRMPAGDAILILICTYVGAIYGGSRTAVLLNIPGTPANAASTLDGYPLARAGRAGEALGIATIGSFLGSIFGMLMLVLIAPELAEFGLKFQSFEFVWLAIFGVVIAGRVTALDDPIKGWIAGFLGLLMAQVGQEGIHAYARFSYGSTDLAGGLGLLPALVGAFGFAEILCVMKQPGYQTVRDAGRRILPRLRDITTRWWTVLRSSVLGTVMGIVPGVGEDMG
ncbi:MAG TPA: tripartite tricarboxylate transporter permease, partial [Burkholderiales bacterium]|nr:tripartite tricarboxylate transporter permease [Burkholderiales bacterium]